MRESKIEKALVKEAKKLGWLSIKLNGAHNRGKPDQLFLKDGRAVFMEIKAPGKSLRKLQEFWKRQIDASGHTVHRVDSVGRGLEILSKVSL